MRFGISHCNVGEFAEPDRARDLARLTEQAGFESLWTVEHVVIPEVYEPRYPETPDGRFWFRHDLPLADPLIWMAFVAAATTRLRLGTGIMIAPQRNPLITAKEIATLDRLSGGRIEIGVGSGWLREEFEALGASFDRRGAALDESIAVMRELWRPGPRTYRGEVFTFDLVHSEPSPHRASVPIHIGGSSTVAARRAGRTGDGFFPGGYDREAVASLVACARKEFEASGRVGSLEITARWTKDPSRLGDHETLRFMQDLGVDRVLLPAQTIAENGLERTIAELGSNVLPTFA
ncbi:LLM class F420-dependent oxidoreductase [Micromonospora sp. NBC_01638]|uniref:LLM class F420-dependent oxidoreductase n=1 Tax=Micromonospora sp. NBC_01638 TaxID=2975982 RepID=UPI00386EAA3F|nr:LLM class F420-dependent oxidoreductase [Micromonospora sp. NBC_01638]